MIGIIDYDAGNLRSVEKALISLGEAPVITRDRKSILEADRVILPGVGSFGDAMSRLRQYGLVDVIRETVDKGTPFLGICLGPVSYTHLDVYKRQERHRAGNLKRRLTGKAGRCKIVP